jgi:2-octaprenyl-6-methoxyphenol hydroxylase
MPDYDVLIVGGGPVGAALALALRDSGLVAGVLEARDPETSRADPRPIALSHGSRLILERLGVWEKLAPVTPIARIHVSQRGSFGRVELDAAEAGLPALGYVLDYPRLTAALASSLDVQACDYLTEAVVTEIGAEPDAVCVCFNRGERAHRATARLAAVADGGVLAGLARVRSWNYRQAAVTSRVTASAPHRNVAFERFTPDGPLALLPSDAALALVWTTTPERAQWLCAMSDAEFLERLQHAFGGRLGAFTGVGARALFPLALKVAGRITAPRLIALGNAAQALHPVAGQGLNLGLRDAWELAAEIKGCDPSDIGGPALLRSYAARRRIDRGGGVAFTDALVRLFSNDIAVLRFARGLGLAALGALPPVKDFVVRRMTFGARG